MPGTLLVGHVLDRLKDVESGSVQMVVTSPPYFGLRNYKGIPTVWGGDPKCQHEWGDTFRLKGMSGGAGYLQDNNKGSWTGSNSCSTCTKCGAWLGDFGWGNLDCGAWTLVYKNETIVPCNECYCCQTIAILRELRRVLKKDGVVWWNIADTRAGGGRGPEGGRKQKGRMQLGRLLVQGIAPKNMCLVPFRIAMALQADEWYLRKDVIWNPPNSMPDSVKDRPIDDHEYIFLLSKSRKYYYDYEAVKEPCAASTIKRNKYGHKGADCKEVGMNRIRQPGEQVAEDKMRRQRGVWKFAISRGLKGHHATYPLELPLRCIAAGSRPGDIVLDPFMGSGTTAAAAEQLGRNWIGIELSSEYAMAALERIAQVQK